MSFKVIVQPRALQQIERAYEWGALRWPPAQNEAWFRGLRTAIAALADFPARCSLAPESAAFPYEVRQLLHPPYRVLFRIIGQEVRVIAVRRSSQGKVKH